MAMVNTLLSNASTFLLVNNSLSHQILLNQYICQECPFAPDLYVLTMDILNHLFEVTDIQGKMKDILCPDGSYMVNNHFANGSFIYMSVKQSLFLWCSYMFGNIWLYIK